MFEKITREQFINYFIGKFLKIINELNLTVSAEQIESKKQAYGEKFDNIKENGKDIGTISKFMIFGDIGMYKNEIFIQDKKTKRLYYIE